MKSIGLNKEDWQKMRSGDQSTTQLSERTFNLIFGGSLVWGFLLTMLIVLLLQNPVMNMMHRQADSYRYIIIGVLIGYIILCAVGSSLMRAETLGKNIAGYHLIVLPISIVLSISLAPFLTYEPTLVTSALLLTLITTGIMIAASMLFPQFFAGIGRTLGISLICALIVDLVAFLFFGKYLTFIDYIIAGIMALYIGFDWGRASTCYRTAQNALIVASSLYLDIVNLFIRILSIISRRKD